MTVPVHEVACLRWRLVETLHVPQQSTETELQFELANEGGGVSIPGTLPDSAQCILSWAISQHEPSQLQLTETHVHGQRSGCKRTVSFGSKLFPRAAYHPAKGLIVLTADGTLHSLLPRDQNSLLSLLDGLVTSSIDVKRHIDRLGIPTTLDAVSTTDAQDEGFFCIGGQTGAVLVVPPSCFDTESAAKPYELHHNPSGYRALFSKSTTSAVAWTNSLQPFASGLLCVLHADYSLRIWNVSKRRRLLVESLLQQSGQKELILPTAVGSVCNHQGHLRLVVHLEPKAGLHYVPQTIAVSMDIQIPQEGSIQIVNMRERMLEHDNLRFKTVLTHTHTSDAHPAQTWLLSITPSLHAITSSVSGQPHEESCRTVLIEKQGVDTGQRHQPLQEDIWRSLQEAIEEQSGQSLPAEILNRHFMQHLLAPGLLSQQALSQALQELDQPLPSDSASIEEAQQYLTAAAQGLAASQRLSQLQSWRRVVQTYWRCWAELHPAVGLVELPQGNVAIVRVGHMLTLLQKSNPLTPCHQHGRLSAAVDDSPISGDLALLMQCIQLLPQLLGQDAVDLFAHLWTRPPPGLTLQGLCSAFTQILSAGPDPSSQQDSQQAASSNKAALRQWRQQRSAAILQLGHLISQMSHHTPVAAFHDYLAMTSHHSSSQAVPTSMSSSNDLSPSAGETLTIMLRQDTSQQMQSAACLLLLAWLDSLRAVGALHISATMSQVLKAEVLPELQAHLCSTALTQWLCTVPAAAMTDDDAVSMKHSQNTSKLANLDIVLGSRQETEHQQTLAQLLLPGFLQASGGINLQHEAHLAVSAFGAYLQAVGGRGVAVHPTPGSRVVQQVLFMGQTLIELHQVAHMDQLLALSGTAADTLGAAFLKGYAGLHQAHRRLPEQQQQAVQEAAGHLFQTAAVFSAADQATSYGEQADLTASCSLVNHVVQDTLQALTGKCDWPGSHGADLRYFEALMLQSEKWGWPQAASRFAQAALRQIEVVYADSHAPLSDQDKASWTEERHGKGSRLCTNLFVYALEAGQYEDAYDAVQANPVAQSALGNLQRLVNTLMNTSNIATLCSLPYAADYTMKQQDGRYEVVSLLEATQQALEQRAATAALTSHPQPYDVLYNFYCMRSNFKSAAAAQYTLACRLSHPHTHVPQRLHLRATALLQAVTALSMVEPSQQWILNPGPLQEALRPDKPYSDQPSHSDTNHQTSSTALSRTKAGLAQSIVVLSSSSSQAMTGGCQCTDLTKEHAAAHAHALLSQLDPDAMEQSILPDDVFHRLLALGLFHAALSLAIVLYEGQRLSQALQSSIASMVTACVQKQLQDPASDRGTAPASSLVSGHQLAPTGFTEDDDLQPDFEDLSAEAAWRCVMETIEQHETSRHKHRLHLAAVQAALARERRLKLPAALLAPFQASAAHGDLGGMAGRRSDPAALLTLYLQHDRLVDAADLLLYHLAAYQKASVIDKAGHCSVWFPIRSISKLMAQLDRHPQFSQQHIQLQEAVQQHVRSCLEVSKTLLTKDDHETIVGMEE